MQKKGQYFHITVIIEPQYIRPVLKTVEGAVLTKRVNRFQQRTRRQDKILLMLTFITMAGLITLIALDLLPMLKSIVLHTHSEASLVTSLRSYGVRSYLVMIALQTLQVLSMFLPTVAIQVAAGIAFGTVQGLMVCLAGDALGNTIIFVMMRRMRRIFGAIDPSETAEQCRPETEQSEVAESGLPAACGNGLPAAAKPETRRKRSGWNFSFILESKNPALLAFLLFLIPGVPNGILPYVFAKTKITLPRYLLSVVAAMTPNILVSSAVGDLITAGDYLPAIIITIILALIVVLVFIQRRRLTAFLKRFAHRDGDCPRRNGSNA